MYVANAQMVQKVIFSARATYPWNRQNKVVLPRVNLVACCCQQQGFLFLLSFPVPPSTSPSGCAVSPLPPCQVHPDTAKIWSKLLIHLKTIQFWLYKLVFHWFSVLNKFTEESKKESDIAAEVEKERKGKRKEKRRGKERREKEKEKEKDKLKLLVSVKVRFWSVVSFNTETWFSWFLARIRGSLEPQRRDFALPFVTPHFHFLIINTLWPDLVFHSFSKLNQSSEGSDNDLWKVKKEKYCLAGSKGENAQLKREGWGPEKRKEPGSRRNRASSFGIDNTCVWIRCTWNHRLVLSQPILWNLVFNGKVEREKWDFLQLIEDMLISHYIRGDVI